MATLRLSSHALVRGDSLTLRIGGHEGLGNARALGIHLYGVEEAETAFRLSTTLPAALVNGELEAIIEAAIAPDTMTAGRLFEIFTLVLVDQEGAATELRGGSDFPRTFFKVKSDPGEPAISSEQVAECVREVERRREEMYAAPLGDPSAPGALEFRVLMFVERLLLTQPLRVPGLQLTLLIESWEPVQRSFGLGASDEVDLIVGVLQDWHWIGSRDSIDPSWRERNARNRPAVLMHAPRVFATTPERAIRLAHEMRDRLLELLAFHRNSSGVPFATAIQQLDATTGRYTDLRVYPEVEIYKGNLAGGFLSGEDQSGLLADYKAMRSDPFLSFVLYLHAEAQAEKDLDFAYFRYWNLLETVASERVEMGTPVTDFAGEQILKADGKPFDTGSARGRVYELVKRGILDHDQSEETHYEGRELCLDLWDAVHVWYGFRNATAHHGGFNPDDPRQQQQSWYKAAVEAQRKGAHPSGYRSDPYFGYLKAVTVDVVRWVLESGSGTGMRFLESGGDTTTTRK